ncbi:hypothetical protein Syun_020646 [Stephania yunnanensis]|uniref:Uncharacterized protein n=1 Tax=Stephania yunnanensis TaxID=152371 RepID=A0AAP0IE58_9MAGN
MEMRGLGREAGGMSLRGSRRKEKEAARRRGRVAGGRGRQRGDEAESREEEGGGDEAARRRVDEATRQRGGELMRQRGGELMRQRGSEAARAKTREGDGGGEAMEQLEVMHRFTGFAFQSHLLQTEDPFQRFVLMFEFDAGFPAGSMIEHGTSGFGFDSNSNMVTAPDDVWEDYLKNDRATCEDARAPDDAFEDINNVHDSSSTSEPLAAPTEEFDATPTSSRTRTTTADASGNQAKKKRKVSNDVYIGDQMVAATHIMTNEIFKVTIVICVEHDLRDSFINAMAEVHELTDVERAIYGSKIMGRVELMEAFMTLQPGSRLPWLHAMFN